MRVAVGAEPDLDHTEAGDLSTNQLAQETVS